MVQVFEMNPVIPIQGARPEQCDNAISHICEQAKRKIGDKGLDLLIAILADSNGSLYGKVAVALLWCEAVFEKKVFPCHGLSENFPNL